MPRDNGQRVEDQLKANGTDIASDLPEAGRGRARVFSRGMRAAGTLIWDKAFMLFQARRFVGFVRTNPGSNTSLFLLPFSSHPSFSAPNKSAQPWRNTRRRCTPRTSMQKAPGISLTVEATYKGIQRTFRMSLIKARSRISNTHKCHSRAHTDMCTHVHTHAHGGIPYKYILPCFLVSDLGGLSTKFTKFMSLLRKLRSQARQGPASPQPPFCVCSHAFSYFSPDSFPLSLFCS